MITLIAAVDKNMCIGKDGSLPWYVPEDLKHFKEYTDGKAVMMGRKTWESLPVHPLPNRHNIVVSSSHVDKADTCIDGDTVEPFLMHWNKSELCVIGGQQLYELAINYADKLVLTHLDIDVEDGDTYFPDIKGWVVAGVSGIATIYKREVLM